MSDNQLKVYVGGRQFGDQREENVRALALKYFPKSSASGKIEGNVSALYNNALRRVYKLDPDTWKEIDDIEMVADNRIQMASAKPKGRNK